MNSMSTGLRLRVGEEGEQRANEQGRTKNAAREVDVRVTSRLDEVEAGVNPVVDHLLTVDTVLLLKVSVEPSLDVVKNGLPSARWKGEGRFSTSGNGKGGR